MRYLFTMGAAAVLGYLECSPVVIFGVMIVVLLGFLAKDVQDQSKRLDVALPAPSEQHGRLTEKGAEEVQASIASLRRELAAMTGAMRGLNEELAAMRARLLLKRPGPWEA